MAKQYLVKRIGSKDEDQITFEADNNWKLVTVISDRTSMDYDVEDQKSDMVTSSLFAVFEETDSVSAPTIQLLTDNSGGDIDSSVDSYTGLNHFIVNDNSATIANKINDIIEAMKQYGIAK